MNVNLANPFSNTQAIPLIVPGVQPKLTGIPQFQNTLAPSAPVSANTLCYYTTVQAAACSLNQVIGKVFTNTILGLNQTQYNAMVNSSILLQYIGKNELPSDNTGNTITFTQSQLQELSISYDAVTSLDQTGLLLTTADLSNNAVSIDIVKGFAPNGAQCIICSDDHFICELPNTGTWLVSNVANAASWNPLSAGTMETYSDQPIWFAQYLGLVVVFGEQSYEFWEDLATQPFPYGRLSGTSQPYGLAAPYSLVEGYLGTVVFLGRQRTGQLHVYALNGTSTPTIISTPDLDEIINSMQYPGGAFAYCYDNNGYSFYRITFPQDGRSFDYNGSSPIPGWNEVQSGVADTGRHLTTLGTTFNNSTICSDYASGNVYILDPANYTDNGFLIKREFASKHIKNNGNLFTVNSLYLDMEVGDSQQAGAIQPYTANACIECYVSVDGGRTYGQPLIQTLGEVGQYHTLVIFRQLGTARDFVFKFITSAPVPFIVTSAYVEITPCSG